MSLPRLPLVLAFLLVSAGTAPGQQAVRVEPGNVSTVVATAAIPAGVERPSEVRFRFDPEDGLRAFEPLAGMLDVPADGPLGVPLAFWLPADQPAGPMSIGTISLVWPDDRETRHAVEIVVAPSRTPELEIAVETVHGEPGRTVEIPVRLSNSGNLADTVDVRADPPAEWDRSTTEERRVVPPQDRVLVPVRVLIPPRARPGEMRRVTIAATGRDSASSVVARVLVVRSSAFGGLETLPTTVFLGTAGGGGKELGDALVAAVDARGRIGPDTEMWISARGSDVVGTASAFRRLASGPELDLGVRRDDWTASFGDVVSNEAPLVGERFRGRGGEFRWAGRRARVAGFLARPESGPSRSDSGHQALGAASMDLESAVLGLVVSDFASPVGASGGRAKAGGAALTVESGGSSGHHLRAEAGILRVNDAHGRERIGPAGELDWRWHGEGTTTVVHARAVPATAAGAGTRGNALSLRASRRVVGPLTLAASGFLNSYPSLNPKAGSSHRGGSASLRLVRGAVRLQVGASARASDFDAPEAGPGEQRSAWAAAHLPLGPTRLDLRAETTIERAGDEETGARAYHATLPWSGRHGWISVGASAWTGGFGGRRIHARTAGEIDLSTVTIGGSVYLRKVGGSVRSEGYGSLAVDVAPGLATVLGIERGGGENEGWSVSLGVRKRFGMPLPLPRGAALSGIVFDDRNANGRRDPGEPGVPGVRLSFGPLEATTDGTGRFHFEEAPVGSGRVRMDLTDLEPGSIAPPEIRVDGRRKIEIPVVQPGSLRVLAFYDTDGDGRADAEEALVAGASVNAIDADGRTWTAVTDRGGTANLSALTPGRYRIVVRSSASMDARAVEGVAQVDIEPGSSALLSVPLEPAEKPVRF